MHKVRLRQHEVRLVIPEVLGDQLHAVLVLLHERVEQRRPPVHVLRVELARAQQVRERVVERAGRSDVRERVEQQVGEQLDGVQQLPRLLAREAGRVERVQQREGNAGLEELLQRVRELLELRFFYFFQCVELP